MASQLDKLISAVTKGEGKKKSVSVGNVREVLKVLKKVVKQDDEHMKTALKYLGVDCCG
jgi:hypothetical protein